MINLLLNLAPCQYPLKFKVGVVNYAYANESTLRLKALSTPVGKMINHNWFLPVDSSCPHLPTRDKGSNHWSMEISILNLKLVAFQLLYVKDTKHPVYGRLQ